MINAESISEEIEYCLMQGKQEGGLRDFKYSFNCNAYVVIVTGFDLPISAIYSCRLKGRSTSRQVVFDEESNPLEVANEILIELDEMSKEEDTARQQAEENKMPYNKPNKKSKMRPDRLFRTLRNGVVNFGKKAAETVSDLFQPK